MGFIAREPTTTLRATYGPTDPFWYGPIGATSTAGIVVKSDNALAVSAVFGCVRLLREVFGSLPFRVYKRTGERTAEEARDSILWNVLHDKPNAWQTPFDWKELGMMHILLRGNFYCRKLVRTDKTIELIPLNPDRVTVEQLGDLSLRYIYKPAMGEPKTYLQDEMFHVRGMPGNGLAGVSVLEHARNSIGSSIAQETYGSSLFRNGGLPTFWIKRPAGRKWTPDARSNFRAGWRKLHAGAENAGNPPILEDDMELHELGLTSRDSQWIESRGFGAEEICRFFGVSPHLICVKSVAPLGSIEQQSLEFVTYALGPLAARWEQAANRDLVEDADEYYTKIAMDALLRGDLLSRYQAHNIAIQGGWELVNEARALEDRNPIEGGDTPRYPSNMQPAGGGPDWNEQGGRPGKGKPKQPPLPPDDEEPTAYEQRQKKKRGAKAAFAVLLDEAAARIAAAEIHGLGLRADKAADNRGTWNLWASAVYVRHRAYTAKTLDPICAAWLATTEEKLAPDDLAAALYVAAGTAYEMPGDIPALLETWKNTRAGGLAQILKETFFDENL